LSPIRRSSASTSVNCSLAEAGAGLAARRGLGHLEDAEPAVRAHLDHHRVDLADRLVEMTVLLEDLGDARVLHRLPPLYEPGDAIDITARIKRRPVGRLISLTAQSASQRR